MGIFFKSDSDAAAKAAGFETSEQKTKFLEGFNHDYNFIRKNPNANFGNADANLMADLGTQSLYVGAGIGSIIGVLRFLPKVPLKNSKGFLYIILVLKQYKPQFWNFVLKRIGRWDKQIKKMIARKELTTKEELAYKEIIAKI